MPQLKPLIRPGDTLVDIGGGQGRYLKEILNSYPDLSGILFDLPETVENHLLTGHGQVVGGNFFEHVPEADIYLFKRVLHDWNDEDAIRILQKCYESAKPEAKLILHEMILPQKEALMCDVYFMATLKGRQRTEEDFRRILQKAGWAVNTISSTNCWLGQIVATKMPTLLSIE